MSSNAFLRKLFREVGTERVIEVDEVCLRDESCVLCSDIRRADGSLVSGGHGRHHIRLETLQDEQIWKPTTTL